MDIICYEFKDLNSVNVGASAKLSRSTHYSFLFINVDWI